MEHQYCRSALHNAIVENDKAGVERALEIVHDVEERSRSMTPLQSAAHLGAYDLLPLLVSKGAEVNAAPSEFGCVLQASISALWFNGTPDLLSLRQDGHAREKRTAQRKVVEFLLSRGANPNLYGGEFGSPLAAAAAFGNIEIVELLLASGADPSSAGGRLGSALQAASARGGMPVEWCVSLADPDDYAQILDLLMQAGSPINEVGGIYGTALAAAAFMGDDAGISKLLAKGAEVNIAAGKYGSALGAAARHGHLSAVKRLLVAGARTRAASSRSRHANDDWQQWRDEPISSLFLKHTAALPSAMVPVEGQSSKAPGSPLELALSHGHIDVVRALPVPETS